MRQNVRFLIRTGLLFSLFAGCRLVAQEDVADIPSQDLRAGKDKNKRYFSIGPAKDDKAPKKGYGLVVVLPGGPGSAEFHPFVKRIYKHAMPEGYLIAQPVAVKWMEDQKIVWPTDKSRVEGMKFTSEEFVEAVIKDVADKHKLDSERIFTLSWSSSGPAAYAISLSNPKVTGSFIAMSVFRPDLLPSLEESKGHGYFLYHSPDDRVCPFRMAQKAAKDLEKNGAMVKLLTYDGGHGWRAGLYDHIREGIQWLEKNHAAGVKPQRSSARHSGGNNSMSISAMIRDVFGHFQNLNLLALLHDLQQDRTSRQAWANGRLLCPVAHGLPAGQQVQRLNVLGQIAELGQGCDLAARLIGADPAAVLRFVRSWDSEAFSRRWLWEQLHQLWQERLEDAESVQELLQPGEQREVRMDQKIVSPG